MSEALTLLLAPRLDLRFEVLDFLSMLANVDFMESLQVNIVLTKGSDLLVFVADPLGKIVTLFVQFGDLQVSLVEPSEESVLFLAFGSELELKLALGSVGFRREGGVG